ncbi:hypothetical protein tb265_12550 [Gemmatimonadetes bacterium T265]|nr:hypothetical protein tb265_12550 [Gemmatimonadetes bacterium T265]
MHPRSAVVALGVPRPTTRAGWHATPWTTALVVGAVVACVGAAALTAPGVAGRVGADPDLARLLRAMALVKGVLVALGAGAVGWRLRRPMPWPFAAAYLTLVWVAGGATGVLWQLAGVGRAAVALHAAGALLVVLAWRDRAFVPRPAGR